MSDWTHDKHYLARQASGEVAVGFGGGACERAADYLDDALNEIERLRGLADDPATIERAAKDLCEALEGLDRYWQDWADETERERYRDDARDVLRAALNPEGGEQA